MREFLLCLLLFLLSYTVLLRADTLYLRNGQSLEGVFLGVQNGYYKFKVQGGRIRCVPRLELGDLRTEQDPKKRQPLAKDEGDEIVCGGKQKEEEKKEENIPDTPPSSILALPLDNKSPIPQAPPSPLIEKGKPQLKKEVPKLEGGPKEELDPKPQPKPQLKKEVPKLEGGPKEELDPKPQPKLQDEKEVPKLEGGPKEELDPKPQPKPQDEKEVPKLEGGPKEELDPKPQPKPQLKKEVPKLEGGPKEELDPKPQPKLQDEKEVPKLEGGPKEELDPKPQTKPQDEKEVPKLEGGPKEELDPKPQPKPQLKKEVPKLEKEVPEAEIEAPKKQAENLQKPKEAQEAKEPQGSQESKDAEAQNPFKQKDHEKSPIQKAEEPPEEDSGRYNSFELGGINYSLSFSLAMGNSKLEYKDSARPSSIPYPIEGREYPLAVEQYSDSYSGSSFRLSGHAEKIWKPKLDILAGLDYSHIQKSKNDKPAKSRGTVEFMGNMLELRSTYHSTITYNYFSLFGGLRYSFPEFYISPQIRLPWFGSYSIEEANENEYIVSESSTEQAPRKSTSGSGSLSLDLGGLGFGIRLGKEWPLSEGYNLGVELLYSQDNLKLGADGTKYAHTFYGLSCVVKLD